MSGWDQRGDIEDLAAPARSPRWLNAYVLAIAVGIFLLAVVGVARADEGDELRPARRVLNAQQVTATLPPPQTIRQLVNAIDYRFYEPVPAMKAYRLVAAERGWSSARIETWAPFVLDVMQGESGFCWNRRRGDTMAWPDDGPVGCRQLSPGRYEDVGFGQVTTSFYGDGGLLCAKYGVCSSAQILASPYDSMLWSLVVPLELDGSHPWCFNSFARSYHNCGLAPDR